MIVLATTPEEQALPAKGTENVNEHAAALLPKLLAQRQATGLERYGRPLETFNGRDVHRDLLEELLDALQYAVQAQMERSRLEKERDAALTRLAEIATLAGDAIGTDPSLRDPVACVKALVVWASAAARAANGEE